MIEMTPVSATLRGEGGYLAVSTSGDTYRYGLTLDRAAATVFRVGSASRARHIQRAREAGLTIQDEVA